MSRNTTMREAFLAAPVPRGKVSKLAVRVVSRLSTSTGTTNTPPRSSIPEVAAKDDAWRKAR